MAFLLKKDIVLEGDNNHYVSGNPLYLVPEIQSCDATGSLSGSNSYVLMPIGQSIKTLDSKSDDITVTDMLTSTSSAYLKADLEIWRAFPKKRTMKRSVYSGSSHYRRHRKRI